MAASDLRIPVIANKSYDVRMDMAAVSTYITGLDSWDSSALRAFLSLKFVRQVDAPKVDLRFQRFDADLLFIRAELSNPLDSELGFPRPALHNYDRSRLYLR
jgi:hypothetical protein